MAKRKAHHRERFHYCIAMEAATWEYLGHDKCRSGMASAYQRADYFRRQCLGIMKRIRSRILDIASGDEPLRVFLLEDLDVAESEFRAVSQENNNDLEIIAKLLVLIAHLLGWDFLDGRFHRIPVYHQNRKDREASMRALAQVRSGSGLFQTYHQRRAAVRFHKDGLTDEQAALVLSLSPSTVKKLRENTWIDKHYASSGYRSML